MLWIPFLDLHARLPLGFYPIVLCLCVGEQVFEYIEQLDPTTVCMQMGACPPALAYVNVTVPPLPPVLVAKAAALRMRMHDVSATNDLCGTCKQVILDAAAILGNLVRIFYSLP